MLRPLRITTVALVAVLALLSGLSPAWAEEPDFFHGNADCDGSGCEAVAESGQEDPGAQAPAGSAAEDAGDGAASVQAEPSECDLDPACDTLTAPGGAEDEAEAVDPAAVAAAARDSLELPEPVIATSPGAERPVLVRVPVWLWLEEESWQAHSATAEVPEGSVSVTASPSRAEWSMGDGATVLCEGPGVAYDPAVHDPASASPECGHTYTRASAERPGGAFALEVEVVWSVAWESTDGAGGELGELVTASGAEVRVVESHGLVVAD